MAAGVLAREELAEVAPLRFGPMRCAFGASPGFELHLAGHGERSRLQSLFESS